MGGVPCINVVVLSSRYQFLKDFVDLFYGIDKMKGKMCGKVSRWDGRRQTYIEKGRQREDRQRKMREREREEREKYRQKETEREREGKRGEKRRKREIKKDVEGDRQTEWQAVREKVNGLIFPHLDAHTELLRALRAFCTW